MTTTIRLTKVLVPTDFSEPSAKAVLYGQALARSFGASLHVLHAVEEPLAQGWDAYGFPGLLPERRETVLAEAQARLEEAVPPLARDGQPTELVTRLGEPSREIVRFARERGIDLIVMGTHGRGGMAHLLLGSVAEKVVRTAPCPVLTVRHPEHEFVAAERTA
jgi:nucleotide-binding universal stress UspA family protein